MERCLFPLLLHTGIDEDGIAEEFRRSRLVGIVEGREPFVIHMAGGVARFERLGQGGHDFVRKARHFVGLFLGHVLLEAFKFFLVSHGDSPFG